MSSLTFANPSPQVHPVSGAPGGRPSVLGICANPPTPPKLPCTHRICPWHGGCFPCPFCAALGWLGAMGILWVLILHRATFPGCPLCAISCCCSPHLSRGRFACHCAACCSVLSLLSHFPVTGAFWGFPASVLYAALCEPHHPFSLCLGSFRRGVTSSGAPGPSQREEGRRGPCVSFLVTWASVWIYWLSNAEQLGAQRRNKVIGASWAPR